MALIIHSLPLNQFFVPCALFFASIAGVCVQLHIDTLLRDIKGHSGELSQEAYLASWMGHFGTETINSLFDRFSLSNSGSTLNLTNILFISLHLASLRVVSPCVRFHSRIASDFAAARVENVPEESDLPGASERKQAGCG